MTDKPDSPPRLGRIGLAARLAMCRFDIPPTKEELEEWRAWDEMPPVGREFGSPEWLAAEAEAEAAERARRK